MTRCRVALWIALAACGLGVAMGVAGTAADGVGALFELGVSARSLGVGGACAAYGDDAAGASLNPAALGWMKGLAVASLYSAQFGGVGYGALAFAAPCVGISVHFVDSGWVPSGDSGLRFTSQGLGLAAAIPLGPVSLGARWKLLRNSGLEEGHGWAIDASALVDLGAVRVGAIYGALGSSPVRYDGGTGETWDSDLILGAATTFATYGDVSWTLAADVDRILVGEWRVRGGVEAWVGSLGARCGWDGEGPTFGLSARVSGVEVDWSCAVRADLGASHRLSLEVLF